MVVTKACNLVVDLAIAMALLKVDVKVDMLAALKGIWKVGWLVVRSALTLVSELVGAKVFELVAKKVETLVEVKVALKELNRVALTVERWGEKMVGKLV